MARVAVSLLAGLLCGLAIALWWPGGQPDGAAGPIDASRVSAARLDALEQALARETAARIELEALVESLAFAQSATREPTPQAAELPISDFATRREESLPESPSEGGPAPVRLTGPRDVAALRLERLVEGGFPPQRAQWIEQRVSELRMQALEAQYEAVRNPEAQSTRIDADQVLREEIGDEEYARYLEALGRPTRVAVRDVLASSPAERAGLLPGDEVVAYAGQRVFDMRDLNRLTFEGQPGETVPIDVLRDGQEIQLYVPRGPIGVSSGGRFRGRR